MTNQPSIILALDVGATRIGLALARSDTRLPAPLTTLPNNEQFFKVLEQLIQENRVTQLVVGWPRGLSGQETDQTRYVAGFVDQLRGHLSLPVALQDEAVTSRQAEAELEARGKAYNKGDIDSLSAVYILEDFLREISN